MSKGNHCTIFAPTIRTVALLGALFAPHASGAEISWDRSSSDYNPTIKDNAVSPDDLWNTATNWRATNIEGDPSNDIVPGTGDRANIGFTSYENPVQLLTGESATISSLRVGVAPGLGSL